MGSRRGAKAQSKELNHEGHKDHEEEIKLVFLQPLPKNLCALRALRGFVVLFILTLRLRAFA